MPGGELGARRRGRDAAVVGRIPQQLWALAVRLVSRHGVSRTAAVLGHNYPGSPWYEDSYDQLVSVGEVTDQRSRTVDEGGQPVQQPGFFSRMWHSVF